MGGAVNFIREMKLGKDAKVVVLLPDSSRNYMSKFMADDWMEVERWLQCLTVHSSRFELLLFSECDNAVTIFSCMKH